MRKDNIRKKGLQWKSAKWNEGSFMIVFLLYLFWHFGKNTTTWTDDCLNRYTYSFLFFISFINQTSAKITCMSISNITNCKEIDTISFSSSILKSIPIINFILFLISAPRTCAVKISDQLKNLYFSLRTTFGFSKKSTVSSFKNPSNGNQKTLEGH